MKLNTPVPMSLPSNGIQWKDGVTNLLVKILPTSARDVAVCAVK